MSHLERTESGRSSRRPRTTSRVSHIPTPPLERLYSGRHLDDHSYYHHDYDDDDSGSTPTTNISGQTQEKEQHGAARRDDGEATEAREGVSNDQDLESAEQRLEKKTTTRSFVKPENLVRVA